MNDPSPLITYEQTLEALKKLPADGTNPSMFDDRSWYGYTTADGRHCVAGEAMILLDIEPPPYASDLNSSIFPAIGQSLRFEPRARALLAETQSRADKGESWGRAIDRAVEITSDPADYPKW